MSFINTATLLLFMLSIFVLIFKQREIGAIKALMLITLRTIINTGVAVNIAELQSFKWIIIFASTFVLLSAYFKLEKEKMNTVNKILFTLLIFSLLNIFTALYTSSLPVVSLAKLGSYVIVFSGVLIGVACTADKIDWVKWLSQWFYLLYTLSLLVLPFSSIGYLRNGTAFQGLTNQPNMFGIMSVLFIGLLLIRYIHNNINPKLFWSSLIVVLSLLLLSDSRTSLLSAGILIIISLLGTAKKGVSALSISLFSFVSIGIILSLSSISNFLRGFLLKGQNADEIFVSRENQVAELMFNFNQNPLMGTGFSVPYNPFFRSFTFGMDFYVEPGNIFLAVLSFSGIIGFIAFIVFLATIFFSNFKTKGVNIILFISPILISMGEMVFFSSNSVGIFCYMLLALYVFYSSDDKNKLQTSQ